MGLPRLRVLRPADHEFFERFAAAVDDDAVFAQVLEREPKRHRRGAAKGRSTTRLLLSPPMRADMRPACGAGCIADPAAAAPVDDRPRGMVGASWRAPLGVVGFVFEGRPNVFADATGVLRTGNTAVFRIGSDALGTAQTIMRRCVAPALAASGLPAGAVQLIESAAHAAGWALFADARLSLAVARGSGAAVAQLGAVARQHGVPSACTAQGERGSLRRNAPIQRRLPKSWSIPWTARCATR